jgi:hypothetical protein
MSTHVTITLTHSLAHDSRTNLETWLEEAETLARNLCPQHDPTGALTLVATDVVWKDFPVNLANRAQVLAGTHPPAYRARPTWDLPAQHANNAAAAVVSIYKQELVRHTDYSMAESALATALLASIGEINVVFAQNDVPGHQVLRPHSAPDSGYHDC